MDHCPADSQTRKARCVGEELTHADVTHEEGLTDGLTVELDLHRLELRFAHLRIEDAAAVRRLADSIQECGQRVACIAAGQPWDARMVLVDGYRRVAALAQLGRDTAQVQCWSCPLGQALAQLLARSGSRAFATLEEALLLRELIDAHGLTQRDAARQCARDVSWVLATM